MFIIYRSERSEGHPAIIERNSAGIISSELAQHCPHFFSLFPTTGTFYSFVENQKTNRLSLFLCKHLIWFCFTDLYLQYFCHLSTLSIKVIVSNKAVGGICARPLMPAISQPDLRRRNWRNAHGACGCRNGMRRPLGSKGIYSFRNHTSRAKGMTRTSKYLSSYRL